jgi:hypothetical protein
MNFKSLLGILVLCFLVVTAGAVWSQGIPEEEVFEFPLMRPDEETFLRWLEEYENAPRAPVDPVIQLKLR